MPTPAPLTEDKIQEALSVVSVIDEACQWLMENVPKEHLNFTHDYGGGMVYDAVKMQEWMDSQRSRLHTALGRLKAKSSDSLFERLLRAKCGGS